MILRGLAWSEYPMPPKCSECTRISGLEPCTLVPGVLERRGPWEPGKCSVVLGSFDLRFNLSLHPHWLTGHRIGITAEATNEDLRIRRFVGYSVRTEERGPVRGPGAAFAGLLIWNNINHFGSGLTDPLLKRPRQK